MEELRSQLARWWRPLVAVTVGLALFGAAALASAQQDDEAASRLGATTARELQVLAIVALILAAAMAVTTALKPRPADQVADVPDETRDPSRGETAVALAEVAHERDVSMARASDAEERARLADDRLASLGPLEQRVEVAERRALDAERRLDEIEERVGAATTEEPSDASERTHRRGEADGGAPCPARPHRRPQEADRRGPLAHTLTRSALRPRARRPRRCLAGAGLRRRRCSTARGDTPLRRATARCSSHIGINTSRGNHPTWVGAARRAPVIQKQNWQINRRRCG